jgi:hypothetical protein
MAVLAAIEVQDDGSLKIQNFRDALSELEGQANKTGNAMDDLSDKGEKNVGTLGRLEKQAAATAIVFGALGAGLTELLVESGQIAARIEVLNTTLQITARNANLSVVELYKNEKTIEALGITTTAATESLIQFARAHLNVADAAKLARVAQDLAVAAGKNSSQTYELLIQAIQQSNTQLLQNVGIVTTQQQVYQKMATQLGVTINKLDEGQKKQAVLNYILEQGAREAGAYEAAMSDAGKQMSSFARFTETAKQKLGEALVPIMLIAVEAATSLMKAFIALPGPVMAGVTALTALLAVMATLSATVAAFKALELAGAFTLLLNPITLVIVALGAVAAALIYFTSQSKIHTQESVESAAAAEAQAQRFNELYQKYESLGAVTNKTAEQQKEYNTAANALAKLAPQAVQGIDQITGAVNLNSEALKRQKQALEAVYEAQLITAKQEFAKRQEELKNALQKANESAQRQAEIQKQLIAQGIDLNTIDMNRSKITSEIASGAGPAAAALKDIRNQYVFAATDATKFRDELTKIQAAYNKEKELIDQLDPVRRKEIADAKAAADAQAEAATKAAQAAAERLAREKAAAKQRQQIDDQITGDAGRQRIAFEELNKFLAAAGEGTSRYYQLIEANKSTLDAAAKATDQQLRGLKEIPNAVKAIQQANLSLELQKWAEKAKQAEAQFNELAGNISEKFGDEMVKKVKESQDKISEVIKNTGYDLEKQQQEVDDKLVESSQSATEKKIAANNRYYDNLIRSNEKQIDAIQRMEKAQIDAITESAQKRKEEIDDIVAKATLKFQVVTTTDKKISDFEKALAEGRTQDAAKIQADFEASIQAMGAAEKARIDESTRLAIEQTKKQQEQLNARVGDFQKQNDKLKDINKQTNAQILKDTNITNISAKKLWEDLGTAAINSFGEVLKGSKSLKDAMSDLWKDILGAFLSMTTAMVKNWIASILRMKAAQSGANGLIAPSAGGGATGTSNLGAAFGIGATGFAVGSALGGLTSNRKLGTAIGAGSGAATGAMIGTFVFPGVGTAVGAGIGALAGAIGGWFGSNKKKKEIESEMASTREDIMKSYSNIKDLQKVADAAGVSMDILLNSKKPKEFAQEVDKLNKYLKDQQNIMEGLNKTVEALNKRAMAYKDDIEKSIADQTRAIQAGYDAQIEAAKRAGASQDDLTKLQAKQAEELSKTIFKASDDQVAAFGRLGLYASATFAKMIKEGASVSQALEAIGPTLDVLVEAQQKLGLEADTTTQKLLDMRKVVSENKEIFDAIDAINGLLQGMQQAGMLTQDLFNALGDDAAAQFDKLIAKGVDANQALSLMKPTLQALWEAQQKFGFETDAATQALIDQGVQAGIVGENQKNINQQILDVLLAIGDVLGAKLPEAYKKSGDRARDAATRMTGGLDNVVDRARQATRAWEEMGDAAEEAGRRAEDSATRTAEGSSPTGIKQIVVRLNESKAAFKAFREVAISDSKRVEMATAVAANQFELMQKAQDAGITQNDIEDIYAEAKKANNGYVPTQTDMATPPQGSTVNNSHQISVHINPQFDIQALDPETTATVVRESVGPELLNLMLNNTDQIAVQVGQAINRYGR